MWIVRALLKYGYSNFKLEILEYCDLDNLINREQHYLDQLQPEYNILKKACSSLGFKHSEESLSKIRAHLSKLNFEKGNKVEVTDIEKNTVIVYDSTRQAAEALNCHHTTIKYHDKIKFKGKPFRNKYFINIFQSPP